MCFGCVPMDDCHENCTSLLCSLKNLATRAEKRSSVLYLHLSNTPLSLSQTLLFLLCYFGHQNMLPNLQPADYFSLGEKDLRFILEIVTLQ